MTSKRKNTIAWIVGSICAAILVIGSSIASRGQRHLVVAFKEGGQLGLLGTAVGYALARLVLACVASTGVAKAVRRADIERARKLIDNGEDINARDFWGNTALAHAARLGNLAMVALLIERGADPNIRNLRQKTVKDLSANYRVIWLLGSAMPNQKECAHTICDYCQARIERLEQAYIVDNKFACEQCDKMLRMRNRPREAEVKTEEFLPANRPEGKCSPVLEQPIKKKPNYVVWLFSILAGLLVFYSGTWVAKNLIVPRDNVVGHEVQTDNQKIFTLTSRDSLVNKDQIPTILNVDGIQYSLRQGEYKPCTSLESKEAAQMQAAVWADKVDLIYVFPTSFLVQSSGAVSTSWCFVFRNLSASELLFVIVSGDKVVSVGQQRKARQCEMLQKGKIAAWTFDPSEFNWHLQVIDIAGIQQTVWIRKTWRKTSKHLKPVLFCDVFDSQTGRVIKEHERSPQIVHAALGFEEGDVSYIDFPGSIRNSDGTAIKGKLIGDASILRIGDKLDAWTNLNGGCAHLVDDNNHAIADGVIVTHSKDTILEDSRKVEVFLSTFYEVGEKDTLLDYLRYLVKME